MVDTYTKKVFNNFSWLILDKLILALVSLIVLLNVANYYGPYDYGLYQYALSLNLIFGVVLFFVDGRVVIKFFNKGDEFRVVFNSVIAKVFLSLISLIIGIFLLALIEAPQQFNHIYLLLLVNNVVVNLVFGIECYFNFHLKSKNIVIASNISNVLSAFFQLGAISLNLSIVAIMWVVLFSSVIKISIIFIQFLKHYDNSMTLVIEKSLIYLILKESVPLAIAAAAAMIYARTDIAMIGAMLDIEQVGIYSVSVQIMSVIIIAIVPIQVSIYPKMLEWFEENKEVYYEKYQIISSLVTWLFILAAIIAILVAPIFFDNLFSDEYSKSLDVFMIHIIGALFMYNAILRSSHFTITGHTNVLMISQVIAVFINILLNYLLIPNFGIIGAAIATSTTHFLSLFLSNLFFKNSKRIFWIQLKVINPVSIKQGDIKNLF